MRITFRTLSILLGVLTACYLLTGCGGNMRIQMQSMDLPHLDSSMMRMIERQKEPSERPTSGLKLEVKKEPGLIEVEKTPVFLWPWGSAGWAYTWGADHEEDQQEYARGVALDKYGGNIYVTGNFANGVDFSAGQDPQGYIINSKGEADGFITCFSSTGAFKWARWLGGPGNDGGHGVATNAQGDVYITGYFENTVDFDPFHARIDNHTSKGGQDIFLTRFNNKGQYMGTRTWGGLSFDERGHSVAVDSQGNVYVAGYFGKTVDFDPSPSTYNRTSKGSTDAFLTKFEAGGAHAWTQTWGGSSSDIAYGIVADIEGNIYVTGFFIGNNVDLSAGQNPGAYSKTSKGKRDVFISKFDTDGNIVWAKTLGGSDDDYGVGIARCTDTGAVYVSGFFQGMVHVSVRLIRGGSSISSNGKRDGFLCKFTENGACNWVRTVGGPENDQFLGVGVDGLGNIFAGGWYSGSVDFNPNGSPDIHTAVGVHDCFLSKYTTTGDREWTHTWGAGMFDECFGVAADPIGGAYVAGVFGGSVNFASDGFDIHTAKGVRDIFLTSFPPDGKWGEKLKIGPMEAIKLP